MIDTSNWKEFRVGDLFDIHPTKAYKLINAQLLDDGDYPVIANSAYNNGIGGYSTKEPTEKGNMVTFSDTVDANTIFYQPNDFVGYPHVQGLYPLIYEDKWNEYTYSFFVSVFKGSAISKGFDYGNKFRRDIAVDLIIKLPAKPDGEPDWDYMESYMKAVMEESEKRIENLKKVDDTKNLIDIKDWKIFKLEDLFMISISLSVDKTAFEFDDSYDIDFIGRTSINNGIQGKLYELKYAPNEAGTYSVTQIGTKVCQYRENRWYASQNIFKLVPLDNAMNKASKFLTTVITQALKCTYSDDTYSSYPTLKSLRQQEIKLPVDDNGEPDWVYMEDYMKQIEQKAAKKLELFHKEKIV